MRLAGDQPPARAGARPGRQPSGHDPQTAGLKTWDFEWKRGKPKGMQRATPQRLKAEHDRLVQISFHDIGRKLGLMHKLMEG